MTACDPDAGKHHGGTWTPAPRCGGCGHRLSRDGIARPISTRRLTPWYWLAEIPMRMIARGRHEDAEVPEPERRTDGQGTPAA
jgi:hypothetical protein